MTEISNEARCKEYFCFHTPFKKVTHWIATQHVLKLLSELNAKQQERNTEEKRIKRELSRKKREVEKLNSELYNVRRQSMNTSKKRKVMEEETRELRKKLVCCETLLETVPKDSCK